MSMSAVYILDLKGKNLISRNYRGDITSSSIEKFLPLVLEQEEESVNTPIVVWGDVTFVTSSTTIYILLLQQKSMQMLHSFSRFYIDLYRC